MNDVALKQNQEDFIRLLKAQRIAYSTAKYYLWIDLVTIFIALLQTIFTVINNQPMLRYLTIFSALWVFVVIFSELLRLKQMKEGAIIQEEFDIELFRIPQNLVLVPKFIETRRIVELSNKYKKKDLNNWFSKENDSSLSREQGILLTYKENCNWGIILRKYFINLIITSTVTYFAILLTVIILYSNKIDDIIYNVAPSAPFLVFVSNLLKNLIETKNKYQEIDKSVDFYIEKHANDISETTIRQIQDLFFLQRLNHVQIPDRLYKSNKDHIKNIIDDIISITKKKIVNKK